MLAHRSHPRPVSARPSGPARAVRAVALGLVLAALVPSVALAWGSLGHRTIAARYGDSLPGSLQALRANDPWVVDHVTDPDTRKSTTPGEGPRHFIDIDAIPGYFDGTMSHDRATLEAQYGTAQVLSWGIVPWAIGEVVDSMTVAMASGNWSRVTYWTADLCHYVGDLHQPLHCTQNYDGQLTGNNGIHSRYETTMLNNYSAQLALTPGAAQWYPDPVEAAFAMAGASQQAVSPVLTADTQAKAAAGGSTSSTTYYSGLWSRLSTLTLGRLSGGAVETASFVYTAWVNAGYPTVPGTLDAGAPPAPVLALAAGPTPAREELVLRWELPAAGAVRLELFDVRGRREARLDAGEQPAGPGQLRWAPVTDDGGRLAPGVHFLRLTSAGQVAQDRVVTVR